MFEYWIKQIIYKILVQPDTAYGAESCDTTRTKQVNETWNYHFRDQYWGKVGWIKYLTKRCNSYAVSQI